MTIDNDAADRPFWETTRLEDMTPKQWESLCDGCGKCCLYKLEDIDTGDIVFTDVACRLLDSETCKCSDYANRSTVVPDCLTLDTDNIGKLRWMPSTCAYRLLYEGKPLEDWHPLVSGTPESVHWAGISIRGRSISEDDADEDLENHALEGEP
ncbi:MAG: YcgN family cysteine cluster protein [Minwuia sp.]|nr:YcgN family cysteine cluster protein [Minwuia sp.]